MEHTAFQCYSLSNTRSVTNWEPIPENRAVCGLPISATESPCLTNMGMKAAFLVGGREKRKWVNEGSVDSWRSQWVLHTFPFSLPEKNTSV
jgi:hypothetical protein